MVGLQPGQQVHAHVDESAEDDVDRDLQELDRLKSPAQQHDLPQDIDKIEDEREFAERDREAQAEHIGDARDGRGAQGCLRDERDAERVDQHAQDKPQVAADIVMLFHVSSPSKVFRFWMMAEKVRKNCARSASEMPARARASTA